MRLVHLGLPVRADDQHAGQVRLVEHGVQEAERGRTRPLQVVDDDDDRACAARDGPQHVQTDLTDPGDPHRVVGGLLRRHAEQRRERRQDGGRQAGVGSEHVQQAVAQLGQLVVGLGEQLGAERAERLQHRVRTQTPPVLVELAGDEPPAGHRHGGPQPVDERGLADPGRAGDQRDAAVAGDRLGEQTVQRRPGGVAPDQPGGRGQPHREVPLAEAELGGHAAGVRVP